MVRAQLRLITLVNIKKIRTLIKTNIKNMDLKSLRNQDFINPKIQRVGTPGMSMSYHMPFNQNGKPKKPSGFDFSFNTAFADQILLKKGCDLTDTWLAFSLHSKEKFQVIINPPNGIPKVLAAGLRPMRTKEIRTIHKSSAGIVLEIAEHLGINTKDYEKMRCSFNHKLTLEEKGTLVFECELDQVEYNASKSYKRAHKGEKPKMA